MPLLLMHWTSRINKKTGVNDDEKSSHLYGSDRIGNMVKPLKARLDAIKEVLKYMHQTLNQPGVRQCGSVMKHKLYHFRAGEVELLTITDPAESQSRGAAQNKGARIVSIDRLAVIEVTM